MNERTDSSPKLLERLLSAELTQARKILLEHGVEGLLSHACDGLKQVQAANLDFSQLSEVYGQPQSQERSAFIESYLRRTKRSEQALTLDLRALRRAEPGSFDLAVFGERLVQHTTSLECQVEACLLIGREAAPRLRAHWLSAAMDLARTGGRWSRRIVAIRWLAATRVQLGSDQYRALHELLVWLTRREEQRWVQPAALAALGALDPERAREIAVDRLLHPGSGDDFLVRAAIVGSTGLFAGTRWPNVLRIAHDDASEHVRITAARVQSDRAHLERVARTDPSHRVRATALIRLARRHATSAALATRRALATDPHGFVVTTAAEELTRMGKRRPLDIEAETLAALLAASQRTDLPVASRGACRDALLDLRLASTVPSGTLAAIHSIVQATKVGGSTVVQDERVLDVSESTLAELVTAAARDDFGVGVDRTAKGMILYRGERRRFSIWRVLHELLRPSPSKRQGVSHAVSYRLRGSVRSPSGVLAEVTPTRVPGERVLSKAAGGWGRAVPRVEDLLTLGFLRSRTARIASATGIATISSSASPFQRLRGFCRLFFGYARFAELRQQSIDSNDPREQHAFSRDVLRRTGVTMQLVPYAFEATIAAPAESKPFDVAGVGALLPLLPASGVGDAWQAMQRVFQPANDLGLPHLACYGSLALGGLIARQIMMRRRITLNRAAIPVVIGGWGTRGKSGTERLKAALLQGLGYECLVKTTGCEAMFIHAIPGLPAREIFIYRPYDKATIWEQETVLSLAARLRVRVFLWECMALQPDLVDLLQAQWMHDDHSTITNAYPDHEDLQGPTGRDVAETISEFLPHGKTAFTTEQQMLPILRERALARGTRLVAVPARDAELISEDLLARFGHAEHPSNIALVAALARHAGVPSDVAIAEMADHLVTDLGALKTYPTAVHHGRSLSFSNGMGANDRAATLENWQRLGFASATGEPGWVITLVNNRADRPARTVVFADLLVRDLIADRHVLIGTNLPGMLRSLERALAEHTRAIAPTRDLPPTPEAATRLVRERLTTAFGRLLVTGDDWNSVEAEAARLSIALPARDVVEGLIDSNGVESYETAKRRITTRLHASAGIEPSPSLVALIARCCVLRGLLADAAAHASASLDARFAQAYRSIFLERVVCMSDPDLSGDAIIGALSLGLPPGASARVMGLQNIKGTGLDFVYRWVSLETVTKLCRTLHSPDETTRQEALQALTLHDDYGVVDARLACEAIAQARKEDPGSTLPYDAAYLHLMAVAARCEAKLQHSAQSGWRDRVRSIVGDTLDFADAVRRRGMAARVIDSLSAARISHATAAQRMRRIVARSKGAWLTRSRA